MKSVAPGSYGCPVKSLKIGAYVYSIVWKDDIATEGTVKCWGLCCHETLTIFMDASLPKTRAAVILIHEFLHAVIHVQGLFQKDDDHLGGRECEEKVVDVLSMGLCTLIQNNPLFSIWLVAILVSPKNIVSLLGKLALKGKV